MTLQPIWDRLARWQPRFSLPIYKAVLVGLILAAFAVPLVIVGLPFIEFLNGMAAQPKARTQMTYGRVFGLQSMVDREPVPGTVARGQTAEVAPFEDRTIEAARKVGATLVNPVDRTMDNLQRGRNRYDIFCIACHGPLGQGDGPVTGPNRFPAPPSLHTDQARDYDDGTIYYVITHGIGQMPGYADKLEPQDRWKAVHYVRALQLAMRAGATQPAATQPENGNP